MPGRTPRSQRLLLNRRVLDCLSSGLHKAFDLRNLLRSLTDDLVRFFLNEFIRQDQPDDSVESRRDVRMNLIRSCSILVSAWGRDAESPLLTPFNNDRWEILSSKNIEEPGTRIDRGFIEFHTLRRKSLGNLALQSLHRVHDQPLSTHRSMTFAGFREHGLMFSVLDFNRPILSNPGQMPGGPENDNVRVGRVETLVVLLRRIHPAINLPHGRIEWD